KDPIPQKSDRLFYVQLDPYEARGAPATPEEPPDQLTRFDAETLLRQAKGERQVMMSGGSAPIEPDSSKLEPFLVDARWTSADFFSIFDVPFVAGGGWSAADDAAAARVVVISKPLAEKLFGGTNVVGKTVQIASTPMRISGVVENWVPAPHFFDLTTGDYNQVEQVFLPFSTSRELKLGRNGSMNCWKETEDAEALNAPCEWIQYWVELSPDKAAAYKDYLVQYS